MKRIKVVFLAVFIFVTSIHLLLILNLVSSSELIVPKKETVKRLDLRNVTLAPKPKPKPKPVLKPKPKPRPKPVLKPKPIPKPIVEPEPIIEEQKVQKPDEVEPELEPVVEQQTLCVEELEVIKAQYIKEVKSKIEQKKYYPKKAKRLKREGIVEVRFTIAKDGSVKDVELTNPSRYKSLNKGALKTLKSVGKFKPIPDELKLEEWEIIVPIEYRLK